MHPLIILGWIFWVIGAICIFLDPLWPNLLFNGLALASFIGAVVLVKVQERRWR